MRVRLTDGTITDLDGREAHRLIHDGRAVAIPEATGAEPDEVEDKPKPRRRKRPEG